MTAYTVEDFDSELQSRLAAAGGRLLSYININAGELHRRLGSYPGPDHRMPNCCRAMHAERRGADEVRTAAKRHRRVAGDPLQAAALT
jgi:5-methylcytosine-specific restriction protein A